MLLQTNSYVVPKERRADHARLLRRFRQTLARLGCHHFETYEQVGANWSTGETTGRFVQIMRFQDRKHQLSVQAAEKADLPAQQLIQEFCDLINFPYQQQQGLFAIGFYTAVLPILPARTQVVNESNVVSEQVVGESPAPETTDADDATIILEQAEEAEPEPVTSSMTPAEENSK